LPANVFFDERQNLAELVTHMDEEDRRSYESFGHRRIEAAFVNRVFIVYRPQGLTPQRAHKEPQIVTLVKVTDFSADARNGCRVVLTDQQHGQEMTITHVPRRVFNFPIFVSVPPRVELKWDARTLPEDRVWRSLSFALLVKTKNRSDFHSKNNFYMEAPNKFRELYPDVAARQQFKF
jgi:hypothetical protein